jgi:hypothetical protein
MHTAVTLSDLNVQSSEQGARTFLHKLYDRQPLLAKVAIAHLMLVPFVIAALLIDTRLVSGESPWLKPLKFDLSIAIYTATMAWVLGPLPQALKTALARRIAVAMAVETFFIALQAARGVRSHFNLATPFDRLAFLLMGLAIAYNTWQIIRVLRCYLLPQTSHVAALQRLATRLGLISLLLGSIVGGYMAGHMAHAVGVADGGAGLPLLHWSTRGGDLRIAHFLGLHGLQLLLLLQASMAAARVSAPRQERVLWGIFAVHALATAALFALALRGLPLIVLEG